jgi:uncharacterized membrane-anchored protein YjiN (DUF445 family)
VARPLSPSESQRSDLLVVAKRRATGLLVVVAAIFVISTVLESRASWLAWVQATAVASLVGGLADWFAVTALFRRPLGLPIPHTAIVVERKERFALTLGSFVQESFLSPDAVTDRLRTAQAVPRAAAWLADPAHAGDLAERAAELLATGADLVRDEEVHQLLVAFGRERLDRVALAPLAGRVLRHVTAEDRHQPAVDAALTGLARYLSEHGPELHRRLGVESPWWLPGPVEDMMVERMLSQARTVLAAMAVDRDHPLRRQLDVALGELADNLEHSESAYKRGEELKADLLAQGQIRDFAATIWRDAKAALREQAGAPGSVLRVRLAGFIAQAGCRLRDDPETAAGAQRGLERAARLVLGRFDAELARLVSGTIARWDGEETSRRLELLLGPDLQYIRINGTVVGALAGLLLHLLSRVLG